jgi:hypothetical protein
LAAISLANQAVPFFKGGTAFFLWQPTYKKCLYQHQNSGFFSTFLQLISAKIPIYRVSVGINTGIFAIFS